MEEDVQEQESPTHAADPSPEAFLAEVNAADSGWSEKYGGPLGVAARSAALQAELSRQSEMIAAVRVAAIQELLKSRSGVEVAALLGVSKSAISKAAKSPAWKDPAW